MALFIQNEWHGGRAVPVGNARINDCLMNYVRGMPESAIRDINFQALYLLVELSDYSIRGSAWLFARGREGKKKAVFALIR